MESLSTLTAAGLIEKDRNGDILWTWSYPSIDSNDRELLLKKCCLEAEDQLPFLYGRHKTHWYYIYSTDCQSTSLPQVTHFSLVLLANDFHPEKYNDLGKLLASFYRRSGSPASMLDMYLSVITKGSCNGDENGTFSVKGYDQRQAYAHGSVRSLISLFGIEIILVYTAILLKRRVIVYHPDVKELQSLMRSFPALVWHRQNWNILYPWVHLEDSELNELRNQSHFVAGFTDVGIESRHDLYDLFVNAAGPEIKTAGHAKETLAMGKLHKEIATLMVNLCADDTKSDQQIIKDIALKTKELLNNLKSLAVQEESGNFYINLEALRERKMPKSTENFLFNLAASEGLLRT